MVCTFFGHRDSPDRVRPALKSAIEWMIVEKGVTTFYFGNQGAFDRMVLGELLRIKEMYPHIQCFQVLSYFPDKNATNEIETLYPEKIETVPKRFAITYRNRWMLEHSDCVIAYVIGHVGGAAQFVDLARKRGRFVLNLAEQ